MHRLIIWALLLAFFLWVWWPQLRLPPSLAPHLNTVRILPRTTPEPPPWYDQDEAPHAPDAT